MTRVALLGPSHPYRGGIAHYTASLFGALEAAGHEVRLFNFTRQYPRRLFPGVRQTDQSAQPITVPSERVVDSLSPASWLRTVLRLKRFRPEVVAVQWWHPFFAPSYGTIAHLVRRLTGARVVFVCHNVEPHESSRLDRALLSYAYRAPHAFVVQAEGEADRLTRLLGRDVHVEVVPHPVYDAFAASAHVDREESRRRLGLGSKRLVLFFGLVRPYKGLMDLLRAMPRLNDQEIELLVAGEFYDDPGPYRDQVDALGIGHRVRFDDRYVPNEEVPLYFAAADLLALPYRSATGSGILQIAYALGLPCVVTAVGGIPDVVDDGLTALLVPPESPEALGQAIDRFFAEDLAEPMRQAISRKRRELTWERVVEALLRP